MFSDFLEFQKNNPTLDKLGKTLAAGLLQP